MLLYEMLIGQSPFSGCDEDELFWSICNEMPSYPRFLSQQALTILTRVSSMTIETALCYMLTLSYNNKVGTYEYHRRARGVLAS